VYLDMSEDSNILPQRAYLYVNCSLIDLVYIVFVSDKIINSYVYPCVTFRNTAIRNLCTSSNFIRVNKGS
jgi:hypothetical protein